jgi:hypothetical protein
MTRISIICAAVGVLAALTLSAQSVSAAGVTIPTPNVPKVTVRPLPPKLNNAILQGGSQGTHVGIWRDENITRCPALTKSAPSAPPSRPAPMALMLREGPLAGCARTRAGKDPTASPAMPPATVTRNSRRPFSTL